MRRTSSIANPVRRSSHKIALARRLRASATDAERKLWVFLRGKQIAGFRFRRQHPIGPYIVDFYCSAAKLIVELDGSQHGEPRNVVYDANRDQWLTTRGYRVLRFANANFLREHEAVLDEIHRAILQSGAPLPDRATRP
ncbi:MAG: endonuclease domain-containing protein [Rhizomicrobium sp.]